MIEPVRIFHERDHKFEAKDPKAKRKTCKYCGAGKDRIVHNGYPRSMNTHGSSANVMAWQNMKKSWMELFAELLGATDLPKGLDRVLVEGLICFPTRARRDQGNYRYFIEKAMGDTLTTAGYLEDDDWSRYEFGNLSATYEKGRSWMELIVFPTGAAVLDGRPREQEALPVDAIDVPLSGGPQDGLRPGRSLG